jgi:hypothetical protein
VQVIKAAKQNYNPSPEILELLAVSKQMVNDCIRIGIAESVTSKQSLTRKAYHQLVKYKVPTSIAFQQ